MEKILNAINVLYDQYDTLIWPILILLIFFYLTAVRGCLGYLCISKQKLTRKEKKKHTSDLIDLIFSGINKKSLRRFANWILCRCYTAEQKEGKYYRLFVFLNFFYLFVSSACLILWLLALFITPLRYVCAVAVYIKAATVEVPIMFFISIYALIKRFTDKDW